MIGTTKFVAGFALLLLAYLALPTLIGLRFGWRAGAAALVLLPVSGYATLRVLECAVALRRLSTTALRLLFLDREVRALRRERAALVGDVVDTVQRYKPEGLELLFPRQAPFASTE